MVIDFKSLDFSSLEAKSSFEKEVIDFLKEWTNEKETVPVRTSGSTGTPKIFEIEKDQMRNSARMTGNFLGLKEADRALLCLPVDFISGKMMVVRSWELGLKLTVQSPTAFVELGENDKFDFAAMTPLQVENSLDWLHKIKNLIIGGAGVSESLLAKVKITLDKKNSEDFRVYETYGMSETLSHIALKELYPNRQELFTVFEGVEISTSSEGALRIKAPKLNSETLQTTDLVELKGEKQFRFLGRLDHVINSGGAKLFPEELEGFVKRHLDIEVVFSSVKDAVLGEKLVAVIEGEFDQVKKEKLLSLPYAKSYFKPKEVFFLQEIPRTPNGKVSRLQVKEQLLTDR